MKAKKFRIICFSVAAVLLALVLALSIAVGMFSGLLDKFVVGYKDGTTSGAAREEGAKLSEQVQAEGTVLVKNADEQGNALLPMKKTDAPKVNVFGWSATDWVISGSGSGQVKTSEGKSKDSITTLLDALTEAGIQYNDEITKMYEDFANHREKSENGGGVGGAQANAGALKSFNYEFSRLYEPSISDTTYYTTDMLNNAKAYSKTALVAIGRVSGESNDSPKVQYKRTTKGTSNAGLVTDNTRTYLEISTEEEALLKYVGENYDNVIVLVNTTNVMELGFMETIPGLDACLVVATTGSAGAKAIPKLIYSDIEGSISPSGKLADTYAYDLSTSSTYVDTGSGNDTTHFYKNGAGLYPTTEQHTNGSSNEPYRGVAYQDYREGIYMGYKWYETADAMGFWDSAYAKNKWDISNGYKDVVQYPFGYGLSYTTFEWKITYLGWPTANAISENTEIEVGVEVTNTGSVAGQDVVELYYSAPYTKGGIEKSAVNLAAYAKTQKVLQPNETEYVLLKFNASDMASYDYSGINKLTEKGGYILEKGDYTLTLRTDAHTLAGDKIVSGGKHDSDTLVYKVSGDIQCQKDTVENRFTGSNTTDGVAIDGNSDGNANITYLSRADFAGTFPEELGENREMTDSIKALNLYTSDMAEAWKNEHSDAAAVTFGDSNSSGVVFENGEINDLGMLLGKDYNAPEWDALLDRITKKEMQDLVLHGYTKTLALASIGKPKTMDLDGPNQIGSFSGGISDEATGFSSIVLAQSWNVVLAYNMGLAFGKECASYGVQGWYGPGVNPHRSPFGGRNYEYYSEDVLISGTMCANVVKAAKNRGVFCYLKHICLYEGESGRDGMYTWLTEQALREVYLKPFEIAVKEGGSTAIMTSYGRIGAVWTGGSEALLTEVVRNEWGFQGAFLTDYSDHQNFMNGDQMLRAGGDLWMDGYQDNGKFQFETSSNAYDQALRKATKNVVYMWLNALATNADYNEAADDPVLPTTPELNFRWYIPVVVVVDVLLAAGAGVLIFFGIKKKDNEVAENAQAPSEPTTDGQ